MLIYSKQRKEKKAVKLVNKYVSGTVIISLILLILSRIGIEQVDKDNFYFKRLQMVESQIKARGIRNKEVLRAMQIMPRHLFVSKSLQQYAYEDRPLPIGHGQTISQPYIVAFMIEAANVDNHSKVLDIGTGSGYQAAVLAEICQEVYSVEVIEKLANTAAQLLQTLGYNNVHIKTADGYLGWPKRAPFDAIIIAATTKEIPKNLISQLKVGGHIIVPIEGIGNNQVLTKITKIKTDNSYTTEALIDVRFVPLINPSSSTNFHSNKEL